MIGLRQVAAQVVREVRRFAVLNLRSELAGVVERVRVIGQHDARSVRIRQARQFVRRGVIHLRLHGEHAGSAERIVNEAVELQQAVPILIGHFDVNRRHPAAGPRAVHETVFLVVNRIDRDAGLILDFRDIADRVVRVRQQDVRNVRRVVVIDRLETPSAVVDEGIESVPFSVLSPEFTAIRESSHSYARISTVQIWKQMRSQFDLELKTKQALSALKNKRRTS